MKLLRILSIVTLTVFSATAAAEETIAQLIGPVNFNGDSNTAFFRGNSKWGAPGCPNATYAQIKSTVSGRKEMLSIALAAKMAGKKVQFWGTCDTDLNYFSATYIVVVE